MSYDDIAKLCDQVISQSPVTGESSGAELATFKRIPIWDLFDAINTQLDRVKTADILSQDRSAFVMLRGEIQHLLRNRRFSAWPNNIFREMAELLRRACSVEQAHGMSRDSAQDFSPYRVFIGHARSELWRELKDFVVPAN